MAELREKPVFTRRELPVLALLALAALGLLLWLGTAPSGRTAVLEVEGVETVRRELSPLPGPEVLSVAGANGIELTVEFSREGARVLSANCPDKTCQRTGLLTKAGECAVCLPGRVVLKLEGGGEADAQTY